MNDIETYLKANRQIGEQETSGKSNASIVEKLPIAGFIILILLVAQFNSMRKALIILVTIPLGLIGVALGLLVSVFLTLGVVPVIYAVLYRVKG